MRGVPERPAGLAYRPDLLAAARAVWQHSIPPVPDLRWSITFRTVIMRRPIGNQPGEH
jgi:hypothetical protein